MVLNVNRQTLSTSVGKHDMVINEENVDTHYMYCTVISVNVRGTHQSEIWIDCCTHAQVLQLRTITEQRR
jgi:uncharacterized protein with GYD domain